MGSDQQPNNSIWEFWMFNEVCQRYVVGDGQKCKQQAVSKNMHVDCCLSCDQP